MLIVASWFDAQDFHGPFRMYRAMKEKNPANKTTLVVGPWPHGGWSRGDGDTLGNIKFGSKTAAHYRSEIELPFFNFHLKDKGPARAGRYVRADGRLNLPGAIVFETGGNRWHDADQWPPKTARPRKLYLQAERAAVVHRAATDRRGARRVRQRSAQAGAVHRRDRRRSKGTCSWSRISGSSPAGRTCSSTRPSR